jgi:hypothetical protein
VLCTQVRCRLAERCGSVSDGTAIDSGGAEGSELHIPQHISQYSCPLKGPFFAVPDGDASALLGKLHVRSWCSGVW